MTMYRKAGVEAGYFLPGKLVYPFLDMNSLALKPATQHHLE